MTAPIAPPVPAFERALRFERSLVRIRWAGIALAMYQVAFYEPNPGTVVPPSMPAIAGAGIALLAITNLVLSVVLRRSPDPRALRRAGLFAFLADIAALETITWAFIFEEFSNTWIILVVLSLEGARRYQMKGALFPVVVGAPFEVLREISRVAGFGYTFYISGVIFRIAFPLIVAAVAGGMARDLERESAEADRRAAEAREAAAREAEARRETNAFQKVVLAGVSAEGLEASLASMATAASRELGYENIAVLLVEEDRLEPVALHGFAAAGRRSLRLGEGVAGHVAATGTPQRLDDVAADPRYVEVEPTTRSQVTVPIIVNDAVIGVVNVESPNPAAFDDADVGRLQRLAARIGLIVVNARMLARERATVERLRELDAMKSDFIAIASHELRTPLTAMQGTIKTLLRPDLEVGEEQLRDFLDVLDRQSDRLTRLVEDLLIVSRLDAAGVSLRMAPASLKELLDEVLAEIGDRAVARVSVAVPDDMPRLITDGGRIVQIVRNLVENALKFSPPDSVVRISAHPDKDRFVLEVSDDGPGIPPEEVEQIFDRFHQVGGSLRRRADGFGLGLYITKRLVEALRGTIEVDTTVGKGTTFRVRLPAAPAERARTETA